MASSEFCADCFKKLSNWDLVIEHFDNPTDTGPWYYCPECWESRYGTIIKEEED